MIIKPINGDEFRMKKMYAVAHDETGPYMGHGIYNDYQVIHKYFPTPEAAEAEAKRLGESHYFFEVEVEEQEKTHPGQTERDNTKEQKARLGIQCHKKNKCTECPYYKGPDLMLDPRIDPDYNRSVIDRVKKCRDALISDVASIIGE